jgi:hypothetical protein
MIAFCNIIDNQPIKTAERLPPPEINKGSQLTVIPNQPLFLKIHSFNGTVRFYIFIHYRGHHRKGVAIYNAT